jgi:hypothetical protein
VEGPVSIVLGELKPVQALLEPVRCQLCNEANACCASLVGRVEEREGRDVAGRLLGNGRGNINRATRAMVEKM